ncbi:type II toxin-antitoxin system VapC family toxin [Sandaracinobacteroides hominis]|uniref:type II toxin-antitoxin system VapC family toxin n=1 Tax=Sandaracinobacteroides hominis TaxID=2780086 RepID=UPI0018F27CA0|nr:PIN domain-containing protein [Sandaracinobacteroides hominis]
MTTFLDTSVIIDLLSEDAEYHTWSSERVLSANMNGPLLISDMVYCELCCGMENLDAVDQAVTALSLVRRPYSNEVLFSASRAFRRYRDENAGTKSNVLPDFLIGALAEVEAAPLLTRDPARVRTYFPTVELICP